MVEAEKVAFPSSQCFRIQSMTWETPIGCAGAVDAGGWLHSHDSQGDRAHQLAVPDPHVLRVQAPSAVPPDHEGAILTSTQSDRWMSEIDGVSEPYY